MLGNPRTDPRMRRGFLQAVGEAQRKAYNEGEDPSKRAAVREVLRQQRATQRAEFAKARATRKAKRQAAVGPGRPASAAMAEASRTGFFGDDAPLVDEDGAASAAVGEGDDAALVDEDGAASADVGEGESMDAMADGTLVKDRKRKPVAPSPAAKRPATMVYEKEEEDDLEEEDEAPPPVLPIPLPPRPVAGVSRYTGFMSADRLRAMKAFYGPLFPKLTPGSKEFVDAIDVAILFAVVDSIHDFWPERTTKGDGDDDDDDSLTPEQRKARIDDVRAKLTASIQRFLGVSPSLTINEILRKLTGDVVKSVSNIEDNVIAYVKSSFYPFNQPETFITVDTILKTWKFSDYGNDWSKYKEALLKLANRLQIRPEGKSIKSLDNAERNTVAFFILGYMNPNAQPGAGALANFTFDMSPRDVGKIFGRIPQSYNAIFPQNISDSASTSFSALLGRARYFRANGDDADTNTGRVIQPFRSNAFSSGKYTFQFNDAGFRKGNEYGFAINIVKNDQTRAASEIKFGIGNGEQGPSVNYLMDIIHNPGTIRTAVPKLRQVAKLNGLSGIAVPDLFDVLFDIKRGGDHEQMRRNLQELATARGGAVQFGGVEQESIVGVTGDRMAKQFRDLLRLTGMYHSTVGPIDISRFSGLSEEELAAQALEFRRQSILGKLNIISAARSKAGPIHDELMEMKKQVEGAAKFGTVFKDPIDISTTERIAAADHTAAAATAATYMLRLRMIDIYRYIDSLLFKSRTIATIGADGS